VSRRATSLSTTPTTSSVPVERLRRAGPVTPRFLLDVRPEQLPRRTVEILVIGGGVAGLSAAVMAAEHRPTLVLMKGKRGDSATTWAQGGVAVVWGDDDSADLHAGDTLKVAAGLGDEATTRDIVAASRDVLERWLEWGGRFDMDGERIALAREGGHSVHRIVHANGDQTGAEIQRLLVARSQTLASLEVLEEVFVLDLLTEEEQVRGALAWSASEGYFCVWAGATILAAGGTGRVYRETSNPAGATGDGFAMAYRAGAALRDMEFVQFHPTVLYVAGMARFLVSETARGEGGILVDRTGHRFMPDHHEDAELAPRDVVSRAIVRQLGTVRDSCVYLDMRHLDAERLRRRFPVIWRACEGFGIDMSEDLIPVHPAMHYMVGGVSTDLHGRTTLRGLYACGEVACTGLHGANRMGSNSLLEGAVMGGKAALHAVDQAGPPRVAVSSQAEIERVLVGRIDVGDLDNALRALMWRLVGIERDAEGLRSALGKLANWGRAIDARTFGHRAGWELANEATVARLVADAAMTRTESRGTHFRRDFPETDDVRWRKEIEIVRTPPE